MNRPPQRLSALLACAWLAGAVACSYDAEDAIEAARLELEQGQVERALEVLREGLSSEPDHIELNLLYARTLLTAGRPSLAVWSLAKVSADPEHAVDAGLLLARAQMASGSFDDAIASLGRVLEREPHNDTALRLRAAARLKVSRETEALADIEEGLAAHPDDLGLRMAKLNALLQLERSAEATAVMAEIRSQIDALEDVPPAQRAQLAARYCVAEASFTNENGDREGAESAYLACLAEHPRDPLVLSATLEFLDAHGERQRGTELLREALAAQPQNLPLRVRLAERLRPRDAAAAEALLREIVDTQPETWPALADHFLATGDRVAAVDALGRALAHHPAVAPSHWSLMRADLLIQLGRHAEAERAIEALAEPVYRHVTRGRLALAQGDPARALELLSEGIRLWPDGTTARYLAARAAEQLGDFERAESEYKEALRAGEGHSDAGLQLARLLESRGLGQEAFGVITTYLSQAPDDADAYETAFELARRHAGPRVAPNILARYRSRPALEARALAFAIQLAAERRGAEASVAGLDALGFDLGEPSQRPLLHASTELLLAAGAHQTALARIDDALASRPDEPALLSLRADALAAGGHAEQADALRRALLAREPEHFAALLGLARSTAQRGDAEAAQNLYWRAADAAPEAATPLVESARLARAQGRLDAAQAALSTALLREPRHAEAAAELVHVLMERGETGSERTLGLARRALRFSHDGEGLGAYVRLRMARGEPDEALRAMQRARPQVPEAPSTKLLLAEALLQAGRPERAAELLRAALAQGRFPERAAAQALLAELPEPGASAATARSD